MLLNCGVGEDSWESLVLQGDPTSPSSRRWVLSVHWKGWCWSWNSNTLATWCEELTHWKRPWCWERLRAEGEGDHRGWDGWMKLLTRWTWVWVDSRSWWWQGGLVCCSSWCRKESDMTERLNWTELMNAMLARAYHIPKKKKKICIKSNKYLLIFVFFLPKVLSDESGTDIAIGT